MLVRAVQPTDHVARLHDSPGLASSPILWREHMPQVLAAAQGPGAVLCLELEYLPLPLWVDADHRIGQAIRPDHQIPDPQHPDRLKTGGRQNTIVERVRPAP